MLAVLLFLSIPVSARADIPIPTITLVFPAMAILIVPIICIEAWIGFRRADLTRREAFRVSIGANLASTLIGIPLTHIIFGGAAYSFYGSTPKGGPLYLISAYLLQPFLLFPFLEAWAYPLAFLGLLVPTFFVTVWIEMAIARLLLRNKTDPGATAKRWSISANLASYGLMASVLFVLFAYLLLADIVPEYALHITLASFICTVVAGTLRWGKVFLSFATIAGIVLALVFMRQLHLESRAEHQTAAMIQAKAVKRKILIHLNKDATDENHIERLMVYVADNPEFKVEGFLIYSREGKVLHSLNPKHIGANMLDIYDRTVVFDNDSTVSVYQDISNKEQCIVCHNKAHEKLGTVRLYLAY